MRRRGWRVYMSAAELEEWRRRWPCYDGPTRGGWAEFDQRLDLVDLSPGWIKRDGAALGAIVEDCRAFFAGGRIDCPNCGASISPDPDDGTAPPVHICAGLGVTS